MEIPLVEVCVVQLIVGRLGEKHGGTLTESVIVCTSCSVYSLQNLWVLKAETQRIDLYFSWWKPSPLAQVLTRKFSFL